MGDFYTDFFAPVECFFEAGNEVLPYRGPHTGLIDPGWRKYHSELQPASPNVPGHKLDNLQHPVDIDVGHGGHYCEPLAGGLQGAR
ncbi:MAG: hypothetical protein HY706_09380 [Candidatus Hydrogenedentes bacterium]|nr:hypothetical protein [Candidatus Hydrogenedentota bacterium]